MQTFEGAAAGRADRARVRGPSLNLGQHMQQRHAVRTAGRPIQPPQPERNPWDAPAEASFNPGAPTPRRKREEEPVAGAEP